MANVLITFFALLLLAGGIGYSFLYGNHLHAHPSQIVSTQPTKKVVAKATVTPANVSPLAISTMRKKSYPGSPITFEETLSPGTNYNRYVVSYQSDGLKIYGLLTIPFGKKPAKGFPVILFNHGYIPPAAYSTITSYSIMVDPLARAGYIVFKPDYRGNGNSQGEPMQPYVSANDVTDSMNALAAIKKFHDANPQEIGVFGHSMGGNVTLHELVITHDFKAAELMAGVVGNETGLMQWWQHRFAVRSIVGNDLDTYYIFAQMLKKYGTPIADPEYWNSIDPTKYLSFISAPVQIQVGSADEEVPVTFSSSLRDALQKAGKTVDYHMYPGADHNLSPDTAAAMNETIAFFNSYLK